MGEQFIAENVRRLRLDKGLSQKKLAEMAGLSRPAYRNIETGASIPKVTTLQNIAQALDVGLRDLVRPLTVPRGVRFRAQRTMSRRENILAKVGILLEDLHDLEQLLGEVSEYRLAGLADRLRDMEPGRERALFAAERTRQELGLSAEESIRDICGLVEASGIKLLLIRLASAGFYGLSVAGDSGGPAIAVNIWEKISVERWVFTTAHELGHLLLHLDAYDVEETEENRDEEVEASIFASHFLMPEEVFKREWEEARGLPFVDRVFKLKRMFHVSYKTVLFRLVENQTFDNRLWGLFQNAYRHRTGKSLRGADEPYGLPTEFFVHLNGLASDEPERLTRADFVPDRKHGLVRLAVEKNLITLGRAAELLHVDLAEMRQIAAGWEM